MPLAQRDDRMNADAGFTVLELLLAAAVLVLVLGTMAALFVKSREGYSVTEEISDRQQTIQNAINIFRYELSLAGYRGTCDSAPSLSFADPTFEFTRGDTSDSITVRYYEDRWPATTCGALRETRLFVNEEQSVLYMERDGGAAEPALTNVSNIRLVNFVDTQGGRATEIPASGFIGASVRIEYEDPIGSFTEFVVGIKNPQVN